MSPSPSPCWVHSREHLVTGYFEEDTGGKSIPAVLLIDDQHCTAQIRRRVIHARQRRGNLSNRFFACGLSGVVHLCACRVSKREIREAAARMEELFACLDAPTTNTPCQTVVKH